MNIISVPLCIHHCRVVSRFRRRFLAKCLPIAYTVCCSYLVQNCTCACDVVHGLPHRPWRAHPNYHAGIVKSLVWNRSTRSDFVSKRRTEFGQALSSWIRVLPRARPELCGSDHVMWSIFSQCDIPFHNQNHGHMTLVLISCGLDNTQPLFTVIFVALISVVLN